MSMAIVSGRPFFSGLLTSSSAHACSFLLTSIPKKRGRNQTQDEKVEKWRRANVYMCACVSIYMNEERSHNVHNWRRARLLHVIGGS